MPRLLPLLPLLALLCSAPGAAAGAAYPAAMETRRGEIMLVWLRDPAALPAALRRDVVERCGGVPRWPLGRLWRAEARHVDGAGWAVEERCAFSALWLAVARARTDRPIAEGDVESLAEPVWPPDMERSADISAIAERCGCSAATQRTRRCLAHRLWLLLLRTEHGVLWDDDQL